MKPNKQENWLVFLAGLRLSAQLWHTHFLQVLKTLALKTELVIHADKTSKEHMGPLFKQHL